jgi:hypothetical protein
MPVGILVGQPPIDVRGSQHYAQYLSFVSGPLRTAASAFLDGQAVNADQGDVQLFWDAMGATDGRVALKDDRHDVMLIAFVVLRETSSDWASEPGSPTGLDALLSADGMWQLANCELILVPFRRERFERGERP